MIDPAFLEQVRKMTDDELGRQADSAYMIAHYESYGRDHGAKADAIQEYEALVNEQKRRARLRQSGQLPREAD